MDQMAELVAAETRYCAECPLRDNPYVVSDGYSDCRVMCVGTSPGRVEELSGIAFTGKTGEILRDVLNSMGLFDRVYFTNVLKRRALKPDGTPRKPSAKECWKCGSHLLHEIVRNRPCVVLALGSLPLSFMTGKSLSLEQVHGLPIPVTRFGLKMLIVPSHDASFVMRKGLHSQSGSDWLSDLEEFARLANE